MKKMKTVNHKTIKSMSLSIKKTGEIVINLNGFGLFKYSKDGKKQIAMTHLGIDMPDEIQINNELLKD